jgi:hypothetical protein
MLPDVRFAHEDAVVGEHVAALDEWRHPRRDGFIAAGSPGSFANTTSRQPIRRSRTLASVHTFCGTVGPCTSTTAVFRCPTSVTSSATSIYPPPRSTRASTEAKRKALEAVYADVVTADLAEWNQDPELLNWLASL